MPFFRYSLLIPLILVLFLCLAVACDVRDISLGRDPGGGGDEAAAGNGADDRDADMQEDAVISVVTGGFGSYDGAKSDINGGRDRHDDRDYKDAEIGDVEDRRDPVRGDVGVDASVPPGSCDYLTCPPDLVCCESCQTCMPRDAYCPLDCGQQQQKPELCNWRECDQEPERNRISCPPGTMGPYWCVRMENETCALQLFPCFAPGMPCGDSIDSTCGPIEYCGAPECGRGDNTDYCLSRPWERDCVRLEEKPVCGCDGNEYNNDCFAQAAGTNVAYDGPCR